MDGMPFDEEGIPVITPEGRSIQFPTSTTRPRMDQTMRLWISEGTDNTVRFHSSPSAEGWLREIKVSGPNWIMIAEQDGQGLRFPCRNASRVFLPPWFDELLEQNLILMVRRESQQDSEEN